MKAQNGLYLNSLSFISPDTVFISGYYDGAGVILRTLDGGNVWVNLAPGNTGGLSDIEFPQKNIGYCVGYSGDILKTLDGGNNWFSLANSDSVSLNSVCFPDVNIGYAVGDFGEALKTTDGGLTWKTMNVGSYNYFECVHFSDVYNGYIVGSNGIILKTEDGGDTWTKLFKTSNWLFSVFCPDKNSIYISGRFKTILAIPGTTTNLDNTGKTNINSFSVFPVPTSDVINIRPEINVQEYKVILYDDQNREIIKKSALGGDICLDVRNIPTGVYFLCIRYNTKFFIKKIIKI
jgi:hypothetical protein